jgi:PAS domain-containing protein
MFEVRVSRFRGEDTVLRALLEHNLETLEDMLDDAVDSQSETAIRRALAGVRRGLARMDAEDFGVLPGLAPLPLQIGARVGAKVGVAAFREAFEASAEPTVLLDPREGLRIVDVNEAYAATTGIERGRIAGERLFDVFPDNPDDPLADGVCNFYASLKAAAQSGVLNAMSVQRYDVRSNGVFVERYWRPINTPIFDQQGRLRFLANHAREVTDEVLAVRRRRAH